LPGPARALIVHRQADTRAGLRFTLAQQGVETAAETAEARSALALARRHRPPLLVIEHAPPDSDGIALAEGIRRQMPLASVVIIARAVDAPTLQRAMRAGAREVLTEPVDSTELGAVIERLRPLLDLAAPQQEGRRGQVIVTTSNKGGVGKTTIATNLAVGLQRVSHEPVALVDLDLTFGDVATVMDIKEPRTIADMVPVANHLDADLVEGFLFGHGTGIKVLPAPRRGQEAEGIGGDLVGQILVLLSERYQHVVVDTGTVLDEAVLAALDLADKVILVTTLDVVSLKNISQMLDILQRVSFQMDRIQLLANRWNGKSGVTRQDAETTLGLKFAFLVPSDYQRVIDSINRGVPIVDTAPMAPIAKSVMEMSRAIATNGRRPA
jgi:pilus assembly protein CpaE